MTNLEFASIPTFTHDQKNTSFSGRGLFDLAVLWLDHECAKNELRCLVVFDLHCLVVEPVHHRHFCAFWLRFSHSRTLTKVVLPHSSPRKTKRHLQRITGSSISHFITGHPLEKQKTTKNALQWEKRRHR